jgi:hypothetical protein
VSGEAAPGDDRYMTPAQFAGLPSSVHHAVWQAHADGRVNAVPSTPRGLMLRYRRDQVEALMGELAEAAGG